MTVTIVDQIMAFLTTDANRATFNTAIGLAAYAGKSFLRRYGVGGYQLDNVTLGTPTNFQLQQIVATNPRLMGYSERRSDKPERKWIDYTLHRPELAGWVDATFTAQAAMALHAVPGSITLGPGADVRANGTTTAPPPMLYSSAFLLGLNTDAFTLNYTMQVYVLLAADLAPAADLRRIQQLRAVLESDPGFLVSLDGPTDQRPFLFAQVYAQDADAGGPLTQAAIAALFDQSDVLAAFFTPPA